MLVINIPLPERTFGQQHQPSLLWLLVTLLLLVLLLLLLLLVLLLLLC